jgi:hypothetical protein
MLPYPRITYPPQPPLGPDYTTRGWAGKVVVETGPGVLFELEFYDSVRFAQDIATELEQGIVAVPLANVIVVERITPSSIRDAITYLLHATDYFAGRAVPKKLP